MLKVHAPQSLRTSLSASVLFNLQFNFLITNFENFQICDGKKKLCTFHTSQNSLAAFIRL